MMDNLPAISGAGVCRDLAALDRLEMLRRHKFSVSAPMPQALSSDSLIPRAANDSAVRPRFCPLRPSLHH